jgi:cytochrome c
MQESPVLNGLFGRKAGSVQGYSYSDGKKNSGITWDEVTFSEYIKDPKAKVPGTKIAFAGIKDEQKIKDLIAYLHTYDKAPVNASH